MFKFVEWLVNFDFSFWFGLIIGSIILGILIFFSYILNSFVIKFVGAVRVFIIGIFGLVLIVLFVFLIIGEVLGVK